MAVRRTILPVRFADECDSPYFFIEKAGGRKVLMSSAGACSFCMIMISIMLYIDTILVNSTLALFMSKNMETSLRVPDTEDSMVFVAFTFLFHDVFSLGILPVSWMYASEIMPLRTRNKGVALGVSAH